MTCFVVSAAVISGVPASFRSDRHKAAAKTLEDIQQERQANNLKIADLEVQIGSLEGNKAQEQQYQSALSEQIGFIQSNINLLNDELDQISGNISNAEANIDTLDQTIADHEVMIKDQEVKISQQQAAIEKKVEVFKERLCAMYVSGNEQLAAILVGSASFYDMLSRVEMVNRIASNDEKLIDEILDEISKMEQYKAELEQEMTQLETEKHNLELEKESLESSLAQQQASKEEKANEMVSLYDKMQHTQSEIDRLAFEEALLTNNKEELAQINAELDKEEENIKEAIRKAAEEAQRRAEEEARKKAEEERRERALEMLRLVGIENRAGHKPNEMSGGQQQRVGIARAFVSSPKVIFADEPTGNLDSKTTNEVMTLITDLVHKNNQTMVLVTHDINVAAFADITVNISDGRIVSVCENEKEKSNEKD